MSDPWQENRQHIDTEHSFFVRLASVSEIPDASLAVLAGAKDESSEAHTRQIDCASNDHDAVAATEQSFDLLNSDERS